MHIHEVQYDLQALRQEEFPLAANTAYLNHASISPMPQRAVQAVQHSIEAMGHNATKFFKEQVETTFSDFNSIVANFINAESLMTIVPVQSTSTGLNLVAGSINWQNGDEIIFCDVEFPSNAYPWMALERHGVKVKIVPSENGTLSLKQVQQAYTEKTRLVTVSAVQFFTGSRADLAAIGAFCHEHDIIFSVDAIQAIGHIPIDVQGMHIDVLSTGAQKSLMAMTGLGFMYIRETLVETMQPSSIGPNATRDWIKWLDYDLHPEAGAGRFMMGTPALPGMFAVIESVGLFNELGREHIDHHTQNLTASAIDQLSARGYTVLTPQDRKHQGPITTFQYATDHDSTDAFMNKLSMNNVEATKHLDRAGNPYVRISFHCYNNEDDLSKFIALL